MIDLIFTGDRGRASAPALIEIQYLENGEWITAETKKRNPVQPMPLNTIVLEESGVSNKIRVLLTHQPDKYSDVSEIMIWNHDMRLVNGD